MSANDGTTVDHLDAGVGNLQVRSDTDLTNKKRDRSPDLETPGSKRDKKRIPPHLETIFKTLRGITEKTARYRTHVEYLTKYLSKEKVPRGLLWKTQPSFGKKDPLFIKKWHDFQRNCSLKLVKVTLERLEQEITELVDKGRQAKDLLFIQANNNAEAEEVVNFIREIVDKRIIILKKTKEAKLQADCDDKPRGRPKRWRTTQNKQPPSRQIKQLEILMKRVFNK